MRNITNKKKGFVKEILWKKMKYIELIEKRKLKYHQNKYQFKS